MFDLSQLELDIIEWTSVAFNILFTVLLAKEKRIAWIFGFLGSSLGVAFFFHYNLIALTILQVFFAIMGVFGYLNWGRPELEKVVVKPLKLHIPLILVLALIVVITAIPLQNIMEAEMPYHETFVAVFSIVATYLMAWKWLNQWLYWIVIDLVWLWVNIEMGFAAYQILSVTYLLLSVYGYLEWRKQYRLQLLAEKQVLTD